MITKKEYKKLKPYWDYQRKIQFNREEALEHSNYFDDEDAKEVFEHIWDNLSSENMTIHLKVGYQKILNIKLKAKFNSLRYY